MSKRRKLPCRVYFKHGAYYYVTLERKWIRLGKTESDMYRELANLTTPGNASMQVYIEQYLKEVTPTKAVSTQKNELPCAINLMKVFGKMKPNAIKSKHVYQYHAARSKTSTAGADREKALLSSVMNGLMMQGIVDKNPCIGVKKNGTQARERYVTDDEYISVHTMATPIMQVAMDIALLTGLRMGDILRLTYDNIQEDGLHVQTSKTGRKMIYKWSDALLDAIRCAKQNNGNSRCYIIANKQGQRYTSSGFKSAWQRLCRKAASEGIARFQFRDLRTKAACDTKGNATQLLGHSSDAVTKRFYQVKPWEVEPTK